MYSVVLMAALTTGGSAPAWCHTHGQGYGGVSTTCLGCYGGSYYGMCYGTCSGSCGCYGGCWGGYGAIDYGCFGCHGCYGCAGTFSCCGYTPYGPASAPPELIPPPKVEPTKPGGMGAVRSDRARVIVQLPTDAKLYVDDQPIKANSERETFSTPQLERGQAYFYDVRAEAVRDGQTVVETHRVIVRAGQEITVSFPKLTATADVAASDPTRRR